MSHVGGDGAARGSPGAVGTPDTGRAHELATATLPFEPPLDIPGSLAGLGRWGDDLIDRWDGIRWLRTIRVGGRAVPVRAVSTGHTKAPSLEVQASPEHLPVAAGHVAGFFVQAPAALADLAARDPAIAGAEVRFPGIRPVLQPDPFTALVRAISAQQINLRWAAEIRRRLAERYGHAHELAGEAVRTLDPDALAHASVDDLRALQLTRAKSAAVIGVAQAALEGTLEQEALDRLDDEAVIERLVALRGIGRWSAEWFLARTLGRPRVVCGDLGVRKAVGRAYFGGRTPAEAEVRTATAHWGQAAGVAQQLLLHQLVEDGPANA